MDLLVNERALVSLLSYVIEAQERDSKAVQAIYQWDQMRGVGPKEVKYEPSSAT